MTSTGGRGHGRRVVGGPVIHDEHRHQAACSRNDPRDPQALVVGRDQREQAAAPAGPIVVTAPITTRRRHGPETSSPLGGRHRPTDP